MTRIGLTTSLAVLAGVAAVIASCSDNRSPSAPGTPTSGTTTNAVAALQGGGWNPAAQQASQSSDRVDVCHTGDGKHYVQLSLPPSGADAHLGNPSSGKGGHSGDFRVSASSPCPPPTSPPGLVQVCKVAGSGVTEGTNFNFVLTAGTETKNVTVAAGAGPTGTCVSAGSYPVGTMVSVQEGAQAGVTTSAITVAPSGAQQGTSDLANRSASIIVGSGTTSLTFTNNSGSVATGTLLICKVAGPGINTGASYTFSAGGQNVTVTAGAAPNGTCSSAITVPGGALSVSENAVAGSYVQSITGTPTPTNVNTSTRSATIMITAGQQSRITFTNTTAAPSIQGSLVVCKVAGTGVSVGTGFTFNAGGQTVNVTAGATPGGNCSPPLLVGSGNVTVTENAVGGMGVSAIAANQGSANVLVSSDLGNRIAVATITAGQTTTVTFTNSVEGETGDLQVCNIAGTGTPQGYYFVFHADGWYVSLAAGAGPNGTCSPRLPVAPGTVSVSVSLVPGTSVSSITGTPSPTSINLAGGSANIAVTSGGLSVIRFTMNTP